MIKYVLNASITFVVLCCEFEIVHETMEKGEMNEFKRRLFAKLHERSQNKLDKIQKRMEKSKSVDALDSVEDEFSYKDEKHRSIQDLCTKDSDEGNDRPSSTQTVIVEEVITKTARTHDVSREQSISESVEEFMIIEREDIENEKNYEYESSFFGNDFYKMSIESLNEIGADSDGSLSLSSTPTRKKITIRDRISSKLSAAKERRQNKKAENATKDAKKKETREKVEKFILSNTTKQDSNNLKISTGKKTKLATVTIALIEATDLDPDISEEKTRFLHCRFRLGTEKYKSKTSKSNTTLVKWQELFNLSMYDEDMLEISLWDKDVFVGRTSLDLLEFEKEKTQKLKLDLECEVGNVQLFILLTISGLFNINTLLELDDYYEVKRRLSEVKKKYAWYHVKNDSDDVGCLSVIVYGAKGLIGHDYYCILELGNDRIQSHTEFKTCDPNWMKIFNFTVNDITSILDLTIYDDKKSEDVGKLSIPLLNIRNGEKKWFALKDVTQRERAKGTNPRVLLEMRVSWNLFRASIRVVNPKETIYLETKEKLDRHTFSRNLSRAKAVFAWTTGAFRIVKSCFEWESRKSNVIALSIWLVFCWIFKIWMVPLLLLIPFIWYKPEEYHLTNWRRRFNNEKALDVIDSKKENTSLRQKINSLQEMVQSVQIFIGKFASLGERIKNLFNFTVPFLSFLTIFMISVITLVMYLVPVKYIFMIWGIHKFTRKIRRPNRIPNNEIMDLISRVPDDETLLNIEELPLEEGEDKDAIE